MARTALVWGRHAVRFVLRTAPGQITEAWLDERMQGTDPDALEAQLREHGIRAQRVPRATLDNMAENGRHQGVIIRRRASDPPDFDALCKRLHKAPTNVLVLDGVQDPQNLGACLRIACAAGAVAVIVPKDRAVGHTGAVAKAASGAAELVPLVAVTNLARALDALKDCGLWAVGVTQDASDSLFATDLAMPVAAVLGGEARGLRRLTREHCDLLVSIPMAGPIESLNVSSAAAIALFESMRQRVAALPGSLSDSGKV